MEEKRGDGNRDDGSRELREPATGESTRPVGVPGGPQSGRTSLDPDSSLVSRCLRGDETAWEDLVRLHTRQVYGLCYRFTDSGSEAQDLTQEVFLRVFRTVKSFRSTEGSFATWLSRVTRNLLIDHYRRTRQERVTDSIEEQLPMMEEEGGAASTGRTTRWPAGKPANPPGDAAEAVAGSAGSGHSAGFAGNGVS